MRKIYPLVVGLAAPLLPIYLIAYITRFVGADDVPSVAYGLFAFGALLGGVAAGYVADDYGVWYGGAVGFLAVGLIWFGTMVNAAFSPTSVLFLTSDKLFWIGAIVVAGTLLGSMYGEIRARREIQRAARRQDEPESFTSTTQSADARNSAGG